MKGHTYKRCSCPTLRDAHGQRINCPKRHGSWYFMHELPPTASGKRRQVLKGGFATEREARAALNDALARLERREYVEVGRQTVGRYLDQWLAGKGRLRATTVRSYREHVDLYLQPGLGHIRMTDLNEVDIERLYMAMRELGKTDATRSPLFDRLLAARNPTAKPRELSPARIRRVHATLMSALGSAVKRKRIAHNPAAHVELPSGRRPRAVIWTDDRVAAWLRTGVRPPVAVWTAAQAGAFLDVAAAHRLYPLFHLIAYRGLRRGEAVGLRWEDVDPDAGLLRVSQQVVQLGWATQIGESKSDNGARTVTLDVATVAVLQDWRVVQAEERRTWSGVWHDSGLVFTREDGTQLHPDVASPGVSVEPFAEVG